MWFYVSKVTIIDSAYWTALYILKYIFFQILFTVTESGIHESLITYLAILLDYVDSPHTQYDNALLPTSCNLTTFCVTSHYLSEKYCLSLCN